eukprot:scaffold3559_cov284-Chaetoceros_neogracile.AAC.9
MTTPDDRVEMDAVMVMTTSPMELDSIFSIDKIEDRYRYKDLSSSCQLLGPESYTSHGKRTWVALF